MTTRNPWLTLCTSGFLFATFSVASAQLPPPPAPGPLTPSLTPAPAAVPPAPAAAPTTLPSPSDLAPGKSPMQSPVQAPAACGPQYVTCTVMVPQTTFKTITVPSVICRPEVRQQNVTVCRMVPETTMVNVTQQICVPERRTATQPYTVCRMTYENVATQVTVMVPQTETRQGTRTVCKPIVVQESQTVCKDMGQWTTQNYVDCCGCTRTCNVYVPNIVQEQVPVTVYKPQFVEEQFTYQVVTCHPEQRTVTRQVAKPVFETQTREVSYVVPVAKQIERQVPQTTMRQVSENRTVSYTVMVPQRIERQVTVPVCTMVAKQVTYAVPPPCRTCGW